MKVNTSSNQAKIRAENKMHFLLYNKYASCNLLYYLHYFANQYHNNIICSKTG